MKKIIHLWSALLIGLLVSGCSGKKTSSNVDEENNNDKREKLLDLLTDAFEKNINIDTLIK